MKRLAQRLIDTAFRLAAALTIAAVGYLLGVAAFHPFDGPLEGYQAATSMEKCVALGLSGIIFCAVAWRLFFRRTPVPKEFRDAADAFLDPGES